MGPVHLLVLMHGMWGHPGHLAELARIARETHTEPGRDGAKLHLLIAETFREDSTYDGIDWGGERIAKEVVETVKQLESEGDHVTRFSVTGYSLGGLIARYCIGVLDQQGFFDNIEPINFNTIATPHCGLPRYKSLLSSITSSLGPKLLSRTGEQFYCVDKWSPKGRPLLIVMADPNREFYKALARFQYIRIYANAVNDRTVPYVTAAIETTDPFADRDTSGIQIDMKDKYDHVIEQYALPTVPPPRSPKPTMLTIAWFKGLKPEGPILPPFLQFRFPVNILFYVMLPFLIPGVLSLVIIRLSMASHSSRARIKELEKSHGANHQTLLKIIDEIEREMEDAVVDLIDNPDPSPMYQAPVSKAHPIISPAHRTIAGWLNRLPIKKEAAYFPRMVNSHATIISRDIERFEAHRKGESVIRHWADSFVL